MENWLLLQARVMNIYFPSLLKAPYPSPSWKSFSLPYIFEDSDTTLWLPRDSCWWQWKFHNPQIWIDWGLFRRGRCGKSQYVRRRLQEETSLPLARHIWLVNDSIEWISEIAWKPFTLFPSSVIQFSRWGTKAQKGRQTFPRPSCSLCKVWTRISQLRSGPCPMA